MVYVSHDLAVVAEDGRPDRRHVRGTRRRERTRLGRDPAPATSVHPRPRRRDPRFPPPSLAPRHPRRLGRRRRVAGRLRVRTALRASPSRRARRPCRRSSGPAPDHAVRCRRCHELAPASPTTLDTRARAREAPAPSLLDVSGLEARYRSGRAAFPAVRDVSFAIETGSCVALVGESGSGKTTIAPLHRRAARAVARAGSSFDGTPLAGAARSRPARRAPAHPDRLPEPVRVAQPAPPVGASIARPLRVLRRLSRREARGRGGRAARARTAAEAHRRALPGRALGRRASARRDRARARARSQTC